MYLVEEFKKLNEQIYIYIYIKTLYRLTPIKETVKSFLHFFLFLFLCLVFY